MLIIRSALVLILTLSPLWAGQNDLRIVDGDTLVLKGERIRLFGIDAPEATQRCDPSGRNWACGVWAGEVLARLVAKGPLRCVERDRDQYGRTVAVCHAGGRDIGAELVREGAAMAFTRYSPMYLPQEAAAQAELRGIWSGTMLPPAQARGQKVHGSGGAAAPEGCVIKGNVSANSRIYHVPGQEHYAKTRISPGKGEGWFCTQAQAEAAGFRPARR